MQGIMPPAEFTLSKILTSEGGKETLIPFGEHTFLLASHIYHKLGRTRRQNMAKEIRRRNIYLLLQQNLMRGFAASGDQQRQIVLRFILSQRRRDDSEEGNLVYESVGEKPKL